MPSFREQNRETDRTSSGHDSPRNRSLRFDQIACRGASYEGSDYSNDPIRRDTQKLLEKAKSGASSSSGNEKVDALQRGLERAGRTAHDAEVPLGLWGGGSDSESEAETVKLEFGEWDALETKLSKLETAFTNAQDQDYDQESLINVITNKGVNKVDDVVALVLKDLQETTNKFRKAVDNHYYAKTSYPDDSEILMTIRRNLEEDIPNHEILPTLDSIRQLIENGKRGAEN
jgi:hypothetical protein